MGDLLLFHWSPADRRKQILRYGLRPGCRQTTNPQPGWRAPYVCLCPSPSWAWALSGRFRPDILEWDLWQVWLSEIPNRRITREDGRVKEVRTPERIFKRDIWYVGTRRNT